MAHVHEGLRLTDGSGWVGVGGAFNEQGTTQRVMVRKINNEGVTQWTRVVGENGGQRYSHGFSICEANGQLFVGVGLWSSGKQRAAVVALNAATGSVVWTRILPGGSGSGHGAARGIIADGEKLIATGYVDCAEPGFLFIADDSKPVAWRLDLSGQVEKTNVMAIDGLGQGAKIRKDSSSGYVMASTGWGTMDANVVFLVKFNSDLDVEWSQSYGDPRGSSQCFDMLVDNDGNYLMGGHTTAGDGVVNWDYLALKVDKNTRQVLWRNTYGQPRGFDATYIHDEMYGVALDPNGNYLLLGGSGDENEGYSQNNPSFAIPSSDIWTSYLVIVDKMGNKLSEGVYGEAGANNAGEYLSVDQTTGDVMVFVDSDSVGGGFGFLKLTPKT